MINVGGYKVNPTEIENIIKEIKGVKDVAVFGRKNSIMGQIIVANIITEDAVEEIELKQEIKKICKSQLQDFKIPRIIKFVKLFDLTRTGKIKKT
jgi:acyl-coenzyme A synthetase/AMP-(fatty) acid ligase